jgi:hypothetical protein
MSGSQDNIGLMQFLVVEQCELIGQADVIG